MATPSDPHSPDSHGPAPEDLPARAMLHDEPFYTGRQTAWVFGMMGGGFLVLIVLLFVIVG